MSDEVECFWQCDKAVVADASYHSGGVGGEGGTGAEVAAGHTGESTFRAGGLHILSHSNRDRQ
jgi:hypothetical protein